MFKKALFEKHGIRECFVNLHRLVVSKSPTSSNKNLLPTKKLSPKEKLLELRSQVNWLKTSSSVSTSAALSALGEYKRVPVSRNNIRRQRAKSMFAERANDVDQSNNTNSKKNSKDDISELRAKFTSFNFGLKRAGNHSLAPKPQQPLSDFQKMLEEFKKRVELKKMK